MDNDQVIQKLQRLERNLKSIQALEEVYSKINRLINISQQFKSINFTEKAQEIHCQALELTQNLSDNDEKVDLLKKLGYLQEATQIAEKLINIRLNQNLPNSYEKIDLLKQIGRFQEAIEITQKLTNSYLKADTLIGISHLIEELDLVNYLWKEAIFVAEAIEDIDERDRTLVQMVKEKLATFYNFRAAFYIKPPDDSILASIPNKIPEKIRCEIYEQALEIAKKIDNVEDRNCALYSIAYSQPDKDWAIEMLNQNYVISQPTFPTREFPASGYSTLAALEEPLLSNWANQEKIQTAYRFIYIPTFHPSLIIRVWATKLARPSLYIVIKRGSKIWSEKCWMLTEEKYLGLVTAINENKFWSSITWNLSGGFDGELWVFEGWNEGNYKFLEAWSPDNGPAYRLGKVFFDLLPENLLDNTGDTF